MNLDGMELLVRSEVDACEGADRAPKPVTTPKPSSGGVNGDVTAKTTAKTRAQDEEDFLAEKLDGILLSSSSGGDKSKAGGGIAI